MAVVIRPVDGDRADGDRADAGRPDGAALVVEGLGKSFGPKPVLTGVDLWVARGSVTAVLGPSGCGKTTLLRIVAGFDAADRGTVHIDGVPVAGHSTFVPPERRRVGVVPQEGALFPHLNVGRNVGFGLPRGEGSRRRVGEMLEMVGLPGFERRRPHELSGGQQHRVALARALAPRPALIVLDEPFSSLDTGLRAQVRAEVLAALRASGTTAVLVTHDQHEALSVADEVAVLLQGRIAQACDPVTLYRSPASIEVATFVGDTVVIDGVRRGPRVDSVLGVLIAGSGSPSTADGPVKVVLRPEQLEVGPPGITGAQGFGADGKVTASAFYGHDALVSVVLADGTEVRARLQAAAVPRHDAPVRVSVRSEVLTYPVDTATG